MKNASLAFWSITLNYSLNDHELQCIFDQNYKSNFCMRYEQDSVNIFLTYDTCTVAQVEIISKEHTTFTYYIIVHLSKVNEYQTLFGFPIKTNKWNAATVVLYALIILKIKEQRLV